MENLPKNLLPRNRSSERGWGRAWAQEDRYSVCLRALYPLEGCPKCLYFPLLRGRTARCRLAAPPDLLIEKPFFFSSRDLLAAGHGSGRAHRRLDSSPKVPERLGVPRGIRPPGSDIRGRAVAFACGFRERFLRAAGICETADALVSLTALKPLVAGRFAGNSDAA